MWQTAARYKGTRFPINMMIYRQQEQSRRRKMLAVASKGWLHVIQYDTMTRNISKGELSFSYLSATIIVVVLDLWSTSTYYDLRVHTMIYEYICWYTSTYYDLWVHIMIYEYILWSTSTYYDLRVDIMIYEYILWSASTYYDLRVHIMICEYILWSASTYYDIRVHMLIYEYIVWSTSTYGDAVLRLDAIAEEWCKHLPFQPFSNEGRNS